MPSGQPCVLAWKELCRGWRWARASSFGGGFAGSLTLRASVGACVQGSRRETMELYSELSQERMERHRQHEVEEGQGQGQSSTATSKETADNSPP